MAESESQNQSTFPCLLTDKRDELRETLRSRLIECGWRDQVANMCRNLIQKHGVEQVKFEQIIDEVGPKAKLAVPEHVKNEILEMMRELDKATLQPTTQELPQPQQQQLIPQPRTPTPQQPAQKQSLQEEPKLEQIPENTNDFLF